MFGFWSVQGIRMFSLFSKKDTKKDLKQSLKTLLGFSPKNINLYILALKHSSTSEVNESYERLEFLGDAIIGAIVAEYLFKKYPKEQEGFLTEMRAKMVNREQLSTLCKKIGLDTHIKYQQSGPTKSAHKSMAGDVLEALIGAIFVDKGYKCAESFFIDKLIIPHLDLDELKVTNKNYKSQIVEYAQKNRSRLDWRLARQTGKSHERYFEIELYADDTLIGRGEGFSKKKAEQAAAEQACQYLGLMAEKN